MIIAIDAMALGTGRGGDETYTRGLLAGLAEVVPDDGPDLFPLLVRPGSDPPPSLANRSAFPVVRVPGRSSTVRHAITVRRLVSAFRPGVDLLHSLIHAPPWPPVPIALYLPDIAHARVPELYSLSARIRLCTLVPLHVRQARVILTLSEYSRRDIIDAHGVNPDAVFVVPCAVTVSGGCRRDESMGDGGEQTTDFENWLQTKGIHGPFFLYLGNLHPLKNVVRIIQAFVRAGRVMPALAEHQLVVAGSRWWGAGAEERAARDAAPGSVVFLGRVTDPERDGLLRRAVALVYPSLYEGFGLPPVEAMAVGTPVLASNVTSLPEILGDAALLVDPHDVDAIAGGIVKLATNPAMRQELGDKGLRRVARYTPRATAERALEAFQWALRNHR